MRTGNWKVCKLVLPKASEFDENFVRDTLVHPLFETWNGHLFRLMAVIAGLDCSQRPSIVSNMIDVLCFS